MNRLLRHALAASIVALAISSAASATVIIPGQTINAGAGSIRPVGGVITDNTGPLPFASGSFSGTLTSMVITGDTSNPFGGLTFTYLLTNNAGSFDELERMTVGSYITIATDVDYRSTSVGQIPTDFTRSVNGNVMGFDFQPVLGGGNGGLAPGSTARLLVVQTDATLYTSVLATIIDSGPAQVPSFAPVPGSGTAPEPATALLTIPTVALLLSRRRR